VLEEIRGKLMDHLKASSPGASQDEIKVDADGVVIE
jgi:hypothetical protein